MLRMHSVDDVVQDFDKMVPQQQQEEAQHFEDLQKNRIAAGIQLLVVMTPANSRIEVKCQLGPGNQFEK
jgi:hypothetical protein